MHLKSETIDILNNLYPLKPKPLHCASTTGILSYANYSLQVMKYTENSTRQRKIPLARMFVFLQWKRNKKEGQVQTKQSNIQQTFVTFPYLFIHIWCSMNSHRQWHGIISFYITALAWPFKNSGLLCLTFISNAMKLEVCSDWLSP